jgi:dynein intermediate chain 2
VIRENNAIDIYEEYFDNVKDVSEADVPLSARTINLFRDPNPVKRSAVYNCWHPDGGGRLAVAYSDLRFQSWI